MNDPLDPLTEVLTDPLWTLDEAVTVLRLIETTAIQNNYHVALGGSVLNRGFATKDLDVIVYLHTKSKKDVKIEVQPLDFLGRLQGFRVFPYSEGSGSTDNLYKQVFVTEFNGKRVDFIFLLPYAK